MSIFAEIYVFLSFKVLNDQIPNERRVGRVGGEERFFFITFSKENKDAVSLCLVLSSCTFQSLFDGLHSSMHSSCFVSSSPPEKDEP